MAFYEGLKLRLRRPALPRDIEGAPSGGLGDPAWGPADQDPWAAKPQGHCRAGAASSRARSNVLPPPHSFILTTNLGRLGPIGDSLASFIWPMAATA